VRLEHLLSGAIFQRYKLLASKTRYNSTALGVGSNRVLFKADESLRSSLTYLRR